MNQEEPPYSKLPPYTERDTNYGPPPSGKQIIFQIIICLKNLFFKSPTDDAVQCDYAKCSGSGTDHYQRVQQRAHPECVEGLVRRMQYRHFAQWLFVLCLVSVLFSVPGRNSVLPVHASQEVFALRCGLLKDTFLSYVCSILRREGIKWQLYKRVLFTSSEIFLSLNLLLW